MAEKTKNYGLTKPTVDEFYDVNVQNENMDIIDEHLIPFYITLSGNSTDGYTVDKTFDEISNAFFANKRILLVENAYGAYVIYELQYAYSDEFDFSYHKGINHTVFEVTSRGTVVRKKYQYFSDQNPPTHNTVGASPLGHKHTKSEITDFPTSLPASDVSAWAKAASKPSYTASEVGAAASSHTHKKSEITDFPTSMTPTAHTHKKSEIADFPSTETWTFTLEEDGSTVTKVVYVG